MRGDFNTLTQAADGGAYEVSSRCLNDVPQENALLRRDYDISDGKPGNARDLDDYPSSHGALPVETYKLLWRNR